MTITNDLHEKLVLAYNLINAKRIVKSEPTSTTPLRHETPVTATDSSERTALISNVKNVRQDISPSTTGASQSDQTAITVMPQPSLATNEMMPVQSDSGLHEQSAPNAAAAFITFYRPHQSASS